MNSLEMFAVVQRGVYHNNLRGFIIIFNEGLSSFWRECLSF